MKHVFPALCAATLAGACSSLPTLSPEGAARVRGPLPVRTQHPLLLTFPHLGLRRAVVQPTGQLALSGSLSYSSIFENVQSAPYDVRFDAELARAQVRARCGLAAGVELEAETGLLHGGGGSFDSFISAWHDFFGFPNSGREAASDDEFDVHVIKGTDEAYSLAPNELGLQDLALTLSFGGEQAEPGRWSSLVRATIELPTGSESAGFGNGEFDFGLGWCGERGAGRATWFLAASWVHAERADSFVGTGIDIAERIELGAAWEFRLTEQTSLVAQLELLSPITFDVPEEELEAPIADLGLGILRDLGLDARLFLAFQEDLISAAGPDFALVAGLNWRM